ncbi:MAG: flavodoxin family protein [Promethearchaeota archaeon]
MRVTIVNGSPGKEDSNTAFVLSYLIKGMEKAGATIETIYTSDLDINPCIGCFKCWRIHIGRCFMKDDMEEVLSKLKNTDLLIMATPVYSALPGKFQNFINRMVPLMDPLQEFRDGRTRVKTHDDVKLSKIFAVVVGGWWEIENLDIPVKIIEELSETMSVSFAGALRRPHASHLQQFNENTRSFRSGIEEIGKMLIEKEAVDEDLLHIVSLPLVEESSFRETANINYLSRKESQERK